MWQVTGALGERSKELHSTGKATDEMDFPGGAVVKIPPAVQETQKTQVQSLCWEDPLEKGMATHSSILAWGIPWTKELGRLQSMGSHRVRHD